MADWAAGLEEARRPVRHPPLPPLRLPLLLLPRCYRLRPHPSLTLWESKTLGTRRERPGAGQAGAPAASRREPPRDAPRGTEAAGALVPAGAGAGGLQPGAQSESQSESQSELR